MDWMTSFAVAVLFPFLKQFDFKDHQDDKFFKNFRGQTARMSFSFGQKVFKD
jgi:hypothetical protein